MTAEMCNILRGIDQASNDPLKGNNPHKIAYMEFKNLEDGAAVSPWKTPYFVKFDVNYDGEIAAGAGSPGDPPDLATYRKVIVWTVNGDTGALVRSWETD